LRFLWFLSTLFGRDGLEMQARCLIAKGDRDILGAAGRCDPPVKLWTHYKENYMKRLLGLLLALTVMVGMSSVPSFGQNDKKSEKAEKKADKKAADKKADKGDKKGDAKKKAAKKDDKK